jgi:hypothetical protein
LADDLGDRSTPLTELAFKFTYHRLGAFLHFNGVLALLLPCGSFFPEPVASNNPGAVRRSTSA